MRLFAGNSTAWCKATIATSVLATALSLGLMIVTPEPVFGARAFGSRATFSRGFPHREFIGFGFRNNFFRRSFGFFPSYSFFYSGFGPYSYYPSYWGPPYWGPGSAYPPSYNLDYGAPEQQSDGNQRVAWLRLDVQPREASIYVDGQYAGKGSEFADGKKLLPVSPSSHTLRFVAEGYQAAVVDLKVNPLQTLDVKEHLQAGAAASGAPTDSTPPPSSAAPSRSPGRTPPPLRQPYSAAPLSRGNVNPKASTDPRNDVHAEAAPQREDSPAQPASGKYEGVQFGRIVIIFEHPTTDAAIYVDGKFIGVTDSSNPDFMVNDVPPGKHTVVVTKPGFGNFEEKITITPSGSISVKAVMKKK